MAELHPATPEFFHNPGVRIRHVPDLRGGQQACPSTLREPQGRPERVEGRQAQGTPSVSRGEGLRY
jgi:hypothetical protein